MGGHPQAVPVDAVQHHRAGFHRPDRSRPRAALHVRPRRDRHALPARARRRRRPAHPAVLGHGLHPGRHRLRGGAGSLVLRGPAPVTRRGLAADDRVLFPERRMVAPRPRRAHPARRLSLPAWSDQLGRDHAEAARRSGRGGVMSLDTVRTIADAVLYEGYLLYPYRASSAKNRSRWQFGVLGPPLAADSAFSEAPDMAMQCLLEPLAPAAAVGVHLRFLQLQSREVQRLEPDGSHVPVSELTVAGVAVLSWDEAVEREIALPLSSLGDPADVPV